MIYSILSISETLLHERLFKKIGEFKKSVQSSGGGCGGVVAEVENKKRRHPSSYSYSVSYSIIIVCLANVDPRFAPKKKLQKKHSSAHLEHAIGRLL